MMMMQRFFVWLLFHTAATTNGFQLSSSSPRSSPRSSFSKSTRTTSLSAVTPIGPEHVQLVTDFHSLLADAAAATLSAPGGDVTMMTDALQGMQDAAVTASAAGDAAAVADAAAKDGGWWANYISLFEKVLIGLHDTIDQPLRDRGITQTWGISIALFTASARTLLVPLSVQQSKSSEYMKFLKPYMSEIKTKFKDNQDMQNKAMGKLLEDAKQNPLSGCLFSLAQLPLLLGLYRGVRSLAVDGRLDEPFLWIPSLAGPVSPPDYRGMEWLTEGWVDGIPSLGWETTLSFLVMPVLLVMAQSFTMSVLTPPMDDSSMGDEEKEQMEKTQRILKFLPLMIGFFSLQVPAGLTIYWMTSNLFTLTQSLSVRAYYAANPPKIELPDYWDALDDLESMSLDDKKAAAQAGLAVGPSFQSLMDVSKFHVVVERHPLREDSVAWKRVSEAKEGVEIPAQFQSWAGSKSFSGGNNKMNHHAAATDAAAIEESATAAKQVS